MATMNQQHQQQQTSHQQLPAQQSRSQDPSIQHRRSILHSEHVSLPECIGRRVDPGYASVLHSKVKEILQVQHDSFPGSQPVSFETKHLIELEREDYFVCEKTDGVRYLLLFLHSPKGPASFLFDRNRIWYYVPNLLFPMRSRENEYLKDTLMDGELVLETEENDKKTWRFLIFDLMAVNNHTIMKRSFNTRLGMLQQEVIQPFNNWLQHIHDPSRLPPFSVRLKKMERSYGLHLVFENMSKLKHNCDGVIWTPVKFPYVPGTCDKLLKWKPPELNTVDFRISARWSKEHKPIYSLEVLSHGVTYKFYDHFQPEPSLAAEWRNHLPNGRIGEFRYDPDWEVTIVEQGYAPTTRKGGWRFVRFRDDKDTANDENVVKKILNSIRDGITKERLLSHMDRVRAAWKARERGLPMPPPITHKAPELLNLSTTESKTVAPASSSVMTPTSATSTILPSPSVTNSSTYFQSKEVDLVGRPRQGSVISNESSAIDGRRSEADVSSLQNQQLRPDTEEKSDATAKLADIAEQPEGSIPEEKNIHSKEARELSLGTAKSDEKALGLVNKREGSPQGDTVERKRFRSLTGKEKRNVDAEISSSTPDAKQADESTGESRPKEEQSISTSIDVLDKQTTTDEDKSISDASSTVTEASGLRQPEEKAASERETHTARARRRKVSTGMSLAGEREGRSCIEASEEETCRTNTKMRKISGRPREAQENTQKKEHGNRQNVEQPKATTSITSGEVVSISSTGDEPGSRTKASNETVAEECSNQPANSSKPEEKKPTNAPPKFRQAASNIHSLLTTSIEPSSLMSAGAASRNNQEKQVMDDRPEARTANSAYGFATILQSNQGDQPRMKAMTYRSAHVEESTTHRIHDRSIECKGENQYPGGFWAASMTEKQPSPASKVQFINYHADDMKRSGTPTPRSETPIAPSGSFLHSRSVPDMYKGDDWKRNTAQHPDIRSATGRDIQDQPSNVWRGSASMNYPASHWSGHLTSQSYTQLPSQFNHAPSNPPTDQYYSPLTNPQPFPNYGSSAYLPRPSVHPHQVLPTYSYPPSKSSVIRPDAGQTQQKQPASGSDEPPPIKQQEHRSSSPVYPTSVLGSDLAPTHGGSRDDEKSKKSSKAMLDFILN